MNAAGSTIVALLVASTAGAQVFQLRVDTNVARAHVDASRLDPVVLTYIATLQPAGAVDSARWLGERSVQLRRTIYGGAPAWEIVETHGSGASAAVDTLVADLSTLAPLHWGATLQLPSSGSMGFAAKAVAEFRADSMVGFITAPSGRRNMIQSVPVDAFVTAGQAETALRGLPLATGVKDSVSLLLTDLARTAVVPAMLTVTGEDHVTTTAGSYDCWVVVLATDAGQTQYWVSKTDRIVVKGSQLVPETGELLQYTLTRISH
jgi:hypothetical protein